MVSIPEAITLLQHHTGDTRKQPLLTAPATAQTMTFYSLPKTRINFIIKYNFHFRINLMLSDYFRTLASVITSSIVLLSNTASASPAPAHNSYTYVLQADRMTPQKAAAVKLLKECGRELIIIDRFYKEKEPWTPEDLAEIRSGLPGRKIIAYLSIAEAEDYREYWLPSWSDPEKRPDYILEENPDWKGNFKVSYWREEWQNILLRELEATTQTGFDGVLLDIIDAFEYFESDKEGKYQDNKLNPATGRTYRSDMIELVRIIRQRLDASSRRDKRKYLIIPQNGTQLLQSQTYQDLISLQAVEDLFTNGDKKQPSRHSEYILSFLHSLQSNGKGIILTEYPAQAEFRDYSRQQSRQHNITLLLTDRALDQLGKSVSPK